MQDQRRDELRQWVLRTADEQNIDIGVDFSFEPLSGDASFRRYFRVQFSATSLLAVDAPPEAEDSVAFVKIANLLRDNGVQVPTIFAVDYQQGFLLVTDFGDQLYENLLQSPAVKELYSEALRVLVKMQAISGIADQLPSYNEELLQTELAHFPRWFYQELLGKTLNVKDKLIIKEFDNNLITTILQQPQVFVHRDYHCRNLMLTDSNQAAVIDFQGATCGPITYDLVSLLKDCYVKWPDPFIQQSIDYYLQEAEKFGVLSNIDRQLFIRWFDFTGLQRHIKVLGIFARLNCRDGKSRYLEYLTLVIAYVRAVLDKYIELSTFSQWFEHNVVSELQHCAWYQQKEILS